MIIHDQQLFANEAVTAIQHQQAKPRHRLFLYFPAGNNLHFASCVALIALFLSLSWTNLLPTSISTTRSISYHVHSFPNRDKYEGEWQDYYNKDGHGKYFWPNGDRFEEKLRNNVRDGHDTFFLINGDKYDGNFYNDTYNGQGTFISSSTVKSMVKGLYIFIDNGNRYKRK